MKMSVRSSVHSQKNELLSPLEHIHGRVPPLQVADIVLIRHKKKFLRYLVRRVTNSYWDHTAMIVFTKDPEKGYTHDIIEESIQFGALNALRRGVELHRLTKYLDRPDLYDVGIKRCDGLDEGTRERARSFMLMNVDTPYYRLPTMDFLFASFSKGIREYVLARQRFSCSGLVQKAFYEASDWNTRPRLIFRKYGGTPIELQELTNPADIASSDNCRWVWNKR
jgi:hypothetical protein